MALGDRQIRRGDGDLGGLRARRAGIAVADPVEGDAQALPDKGHAGLIRDDRPRRCRRRDDDAEADHARLVRPQFASGGGGRAGADTEDRAVPRRVEIRGVVPGDVRNGADRWPPGYAGDEAERAARIAGVGWDGVHEDDRQRGVESRVGQADRVFKGVAGQHRTPVDVHDRLLEAAGPGEGRRIELARERHDPRVVLVPGRRQGDRGRGGPVRQDVARVEDVGVERELVHVVGVLGAEADAEGRDAAVEDVVGRVQGIAEAGRIELQAVTHDAEVALVPDNAQLRIHRAGGRRIQTAHRDRDRHTGEHARVAVEHHQAAWEGRRVVQNHHERPPGVAVASQLALHIGDEVVAASPRANLGRHVPEPLVAFGSRAIRVELRGGERDVGGGRRLEPDHVARRVRRVRPPIEPGEQHRIGPSQGQGGAARIERGAIGVHVDVDAGVGIVVERRARARPVPRIHTVRDGRVTGRQRVADQDDGAGGVGGGEALCEGSDDLARGGAWEGSAA